MPSHNDDEARSRRLVDRIIESGEIEERESRRSERAEGEMVSDLMSRYQYAVDPAVPNQDGSVPQGRTVEIEVPDAQNVRFIDNPAGRSEWVSAFRNVRVSGASPGESSRGRRCFHCSNAQSSGSCRIIEGHYYCINCRMGNIRQCYNCNISVFRLNARLVEIESDSYLCRNCPQPSANVNCQSCDEQFSRNRGRVVRHGTHGYYCNECIRSDGASCDRCGNRYSTNSSFMRFYEGEADENGDQYGDDYYICGSCRAGGLFRCCRGKFGP